MKQFFHKDILFATLFVCLFAFVIQVVVSINFDLFNSFQESLNDFEITDIAFSQHFLHSEQIPIDKNVYLVNTGITNRKQKAEAIRIISKFQPKVIGLDGSFVAPCDSPTWNATLADVIKNTPQLITGSTLEYKTSLSTEYDSVTSSDSMFRLSGREGFMNFIAKDSLSTIRLYSPQVNLLGKTLFSFSSLVVEKFDSSAFKVLEGRHSENEIINYKRNMDKYTIFDVNDIRETNMALNEIKNKIVLLGFMGPDISTKVLKDNHFTPLSASNTGQSGPNMYGLLIHANIISMLLEKPPSFINRMWKPLLYFLSFIICYFHMYFFIVYFVERHALFYFFAKLFQLLSSIVIVGLAIVSFINFQFKIDTTVILLPIILSFDLLYLYDAIVKTLHKRFGYSTYFIKEH